MESLIYRRRDKAPRPMAKGFFPGASAETSTRMVYADHYWMPLLNGSRNKQLRLRRQWNPIEPIASPGCAIKKQHTKRTALGPQPPPQHHLRLNKQTPDKYALVYRDAIASASGCIPTSASIILRSDRVTRRREPRSYCLAIRVNFPVLPRLLIRLERSTRESISLQLSHCAVALVACVPRPTSTPGQRRAPKSLPTRRPIPRFQLFLRISLRLGGFPSEVGKKTTSAPVLLSRAAPCTGHYLLFALLFRHADISLGAPPIRVVCPPPPRPSLSLARARRGAGGRRVFGGLFEKGTRKRREARRAPHRRALLARIPMTRRDCARCRVTARVYDGALSRARVTRPRRSRR
ncbi:unnamed protein product, partial [Iphiclides podalirius]